MAVFKECYVAYLDALGFSELVQRSVRDEQVLDRLRHLQEVMGRLYSGRKLVTGETNDGEITRYSLKIQTRTFSDSFVIFMATEHGEIGHLLFVLRYLHDELLRLGVCVRGGVTIGDMLWDDSWYEHDTESPPYTVGPGLNRAYLLENEYAQMPRIVIDTSIDQLLSDMDPAPWPLIERGSVIPGSDLLKSDPALALRHLDLLHPIMQRAQGEYVMNPPRGNMGFSIEWFENSPSNYTDIVYRMVRLIASTLAQEGLSDQVRQKYLWLRRHITACEHPRD